MYDVCTFSINACNHLVLITTYIFLYIYFVFLSWKLIQSRKITRDFLSLIKRHICRYFLPITRYLHLFGFPFLETNSIEKNYWSLKPFPSRCLVILIIQHLGKNCPSTDRYLLTTFPFRYQNAMAVEKKVFKNLKLFMENKKEGDDLFDRLNTTILNQYLNSLMDGLTAKASIRLMLLVFRPASTSSQRMKNPASWSSLSVDLAEEVFLREYLFQLRL